MAENDGFDDITTALPNNNTTDITDAPADESPYATVAKTQKENLYASCEKPEIPSNDTNGVKYQGDEADGGYVQLPVPESRDNDEKGKNKSSENSMIPKVLKFLTVVLLIAVIAMAFVLYHLDQEISKNESTRNRLIAGLEKKVAESSGHGTQLKKEIASLEGKLQLQQKADNTSIGKIEKEITEERSEAEKAKKAILQNKILISQQKNETEKMVQHVETEVKNGTLMTNKKIKAVEEKTDTNSDRISTQKNTTEDMVQKVETDVQVEVTNRKESITEVEEMTNNITKDVETIKANNTKSEEELKGLIKKNERGITAATDDATKKIKSIKAAAVQTNEEVKALNKTLIKDVEEQKGVSKELNENLTQLNMYRQFQETFKNTVGMSFKDVVRLTRLVHDRVSEDIPELKSLAKTRNDFNQYNNTWCIQYKDVIKLVKKLELKDGKATFLLKIDYLYNETIKYQAKWGSIPFPDVFKYLTNLDFEVGKGIPLIRKIDHMYTVFNKSYHEKWGMNFTDLMALVKKIDFEEKGPVPLLTKIDSWYVDKFRQTWGDSFKGLVIQLVNSGIIHNETIRGKLQQISQKNGTLKFLPASFERTKPNTQSDPDQPNLAVFGFIEATFTHSFYNKTTNSTTNVTDVGTINRDGLTSGTAGVLCTDAGYKGGSYDVTTIYNKIKHETDRSKLQFLFSYLHCDVDAKTIAGCQHEKKLFKHRTDDVAIECTL